MARKGSSGWSGGGGERPAPELANVRTKPPKIYDNLARRLLWLGVTLSIITFVGLIVRYAVQEFEPAITLTTARVNNKDIASLSVSRNFLERMLEFAEESLAIVAAALPLGFPLCALLNSRLARRRAGARIRILEPRVLQVIPKYVVIGDAQACQMANGSSRLRPLVRDTLCQLIRAQLKPKLCVEDSQEEARRLGIRMGLIRRRHHRLAVVKAVDLLRNITDSRGDIKQAKVRYLLSRLKIVSQSTPADKSLLVYLIKYCERQPNENLVYLGHTFTDPEAMQMADCALAFADCDDEDVRRHAQVLLRCPDTATAFTDLYLFLMVCLMAANITQSYALYQLSASVCCCLYRFLSVAVFREQLMTHSQFGLLCLLQQVLAIMALMTKWLSSLAQQPLVAQVAEMSHAATEDHAEALAADKQRRHPQHHSKQPEAACSIHLPSNNNTASSSNASRTASASSSSASSSSSSGQEEAEEPATRGRVRGHHHQGEQHLQLSGVDLNQAVISGPVASPYRHTFRGSALIDDVTYRLAKLHITYQLLVMVIIMIFGEAMFQLNMENNRQHQTLAFNSLMMNSVFNLANCFNQSGQFNLRAGLATHPFFVCLLLAAVFVQVLLSELNLFGLANLSPMQWFVCFVFALLGALIAPLSSQQQQQQQHRSSPPKPPPPNKHPASPHADGRLPLQKMMQPATAKQQQLMSPSQGPTAISVAQKTRGRRRKSRAPRGQPLDASG